MIAADSVGGERERIRDARVETRGGVIDGVRRDFERGRRAAHPFYLLGDAANGGVPAFAHFSDDAGDGFERGERLAEYEVRRLAGRQAQSPAPRQLAFGGVRAANYLHDRYPPKPRASVSMHSARNSSTLAFGTRS